MNEQDMEVFIQETIETYVNEGDPNNPDIDISTFEAAGVLTNNAGLVIRLDDGSEFQVTIVQSRRAS